MGRRNKALKKKLSAEIKELQLTQPIDGNNNRSEDHTIASRFAIQYIICLASSDNVVMEELVKTLPAKLIISASGVRILDISLGQGMFLK